MHILHIAAECAPVAKAGGLGDVLLGLSRELAHQKHQVDILIPKYDCLRTSFLNDLKKTPFTFTTEYRGKTYQNSVYEGRYDELKLTLIHPEQPLTFFDRGDIYGQQDDIDRFTYFSKACADYIEAKGLQPDIIQTHDWQTAIIPLLLKKRIPVIQTIHNLHYQGKCDAYHLDALGLNPDLKKILADPFDPNLINLLKAGIIYSQAIVTVSPTYRKEILTKEFGEGLDETLVQHQNKLFGILNGIDYTYWNPASDHILPLSFSSDNLEGRTKIKEILQKSLSLSCEDKPIVCSISRLVPQKGIPLIKRAIARTLEQGGQFVLVGSSPIDEVAHEFQHLKETHHGNPDLAMVLSFEHDLVHWLYAGCDMIIVPSVFEPCGLTQLIALRYGTLPIVRRTGGLADTIFDIEEHPDLGNGFTFNQYNSSAMDFALDRAFNLWQNDRDSWNRVVRRAMKQDHSWSSQAAKYVDIYRNIAKQSIYEFA